MSKVLLFVFICVALSTARKCYNDEIEIQEICYTNSSLAYNRTFEFFWEYALVDTNLDSNKTRVLLYDRLAVINSEYLQYGVLGQPLCNQDDCYDVDIQVEVFNSGSVQVAITAVNRGKKFPIEFEKTEVSMRNYFDSGNFSFEGLDTKYNSYSDTNEVYCKPGTTQAMNNDYCYMCGAGYFDDGGRCIDCPKGGYQPEAGQTECVPCAEGLTTYDISSTRETQCLEYCGPGYKINLSTRFCEVCGYGYYQSRPGQQTCDKCQAGYTTYANNTGQDDQCFYLCNAGYEMAEDGNCEPCAVGYYRSNFGEETRRCIPCDYGFTTKDVGSTSRDDCNRVLCFAGRYRLGDDPGTCTLCPIGTYKTESMDNCTRCSGDPMYWRTDMEGATSSAECKFYCPAGYYIDNNQCDPCPLDTYKEYTSFYSTSCTPCPDNLKTGDIASTSPNDCRYAKCSRGQQNNPANTMICEDCDYGYYQDQVHPVDRKCQPCMEGTSTRVTKATSVDQCEAYCESGFEMTTSSTCIMCARGYYKDNTLSPVAKFDKCSMCPVEYTTSGEGATIMDDCNIANCIAGSYINEVNKCVECPRGTYQDAKWQKECIPCQDPESTTVGTGSTSPTQCNIYPNRTTVLFKLKLDIQWDDALWDFTTGQYQNLKNQVLTQINHALADIGSYRQGLRLLAMVPGSIDIHMHALFNKEDPGFFLEIKTLLNTHIEMGYISSETVDNMAPLPIESRSSNVLEIGIKPSDLITDCPYGEYYAYSFGTCEECSVNWYQPTTITNVCVPCPSGTQTQGTGAHGDVNTVCKVVCPAGTEGVTGQCKPCNKGSYKPGTGIESCTLCGSGLTTETDGATNQNMCYASCDLGSYSDGNNICRQCPLHTYNDKVDVRSCDACPEGETTDTVGAKTQNECKGPCERSFASYCKNGGSCIVKGGKAECLCTERFQGDACEKTKSSAISGMGEEEVITYSAIGAGGLVLIIVIVCVSVCCCRARRNSSKSSTSGGSSTNGHPDVERLNSNSTVNSDVPVYGQLPLVQKQFDGTNSMRSNHSSLPNGFVDGTNSMRSSHSGYPNGFVNGAFTMDNVYGSMPRGTSAYGSMARPGSAVFQAVPSIKSKNSFDSGSSLPPYAPGEPFHNQNTIYRDLSRTQMAPSVRSTGTLRTLPEDTVPAEVRRSNLKKSKKSKKEKKNVTFAQKKDSKIKKRKSIKYEDLPAPPVPTRPAVMDEPDYITPIRQTQRQSSLESDCGSISGFSNNSSSAIYETIPLRKTDSNDSKQKPKKKDKDGKEPDYIDLIQDNEQYPTMNRTGTLGSNISIVHVSNYGR